MELAELFLDGSDVGGVFEQVRRKTSDARCGTWSVWSDRYREPLGEPRAG